MRIRGYFLHFAKVFYVYMFIIGIYEVNCFFMEAFTLAEEDANPLGNSHAMQYVNSGEGMRIFIVF